MFSSIFIAAAFHFLPSLLAWEATPLPVSLSANESSSSPILQIHPQDPILNKETVANNEKIAQQTQPKLQILVGTCKTNVKERIEKNIMQTWGRDHPNIKFAVGVDEYQNVLSLLADGNARDITVVPIDADDGEYPPHRKELMIWRYLYQNAENSDWFLRSDDDTYIAMPKLMSKLAQLPTDRPYVTGATMKYSPGVGHGGDASWVPAEEEYVNAGNPGDRRLPEQFYCQGMAILMNRKALDELGPHLDKCLESVDKQVYPGLTSSDVALGWCLSNFTNVNPCTQLYSSQHHEKDDQSQEELAKTRVNIEEAAFRYDMPENGAPPGSAPEQILAMLVEKFDKDSSVYDGIAFHPAKLFESMHFLRSKNRQ